MYAPSLNKFFEAFDNKYQSSVVKSDMSDDYLLALLHLGCLVVKGKLYECGPEWSFLTLSGVRRAAAFKKKLLEQKEVVAILENVGDEGKYAEEIEQALIDKYPIETTRTYLSWLETFGLLQLIDRKYKVSNEEEEEDNQADYPSLDDFVSIKDEKLSIYEYLRRLKRGVIILSPDFQRHEVWKKEQKSKFIESVLMGLPLPPIYLKKDSETRYIVVDGLQRTSTLRDFMNGTLQLSGLEPEGQNVLNGATINSLDTIKEGLRARMEDRQLFVYVMEPSVPMSVVYDVFNRINTGGTQLSRQEIRNCIFQGNSTRLIKTIAESDTFKESIDYGIQSLRMKDREAVLRCLAFVVLNYELDYDGSMDKYLEKAMIKINKMSSEEVDCLERNAIKVFGRTQEVFGESNFRIPTDYTRGRINIAVMESIFQCFYQKNGSAPIKKSTVQKLQKVFSNLLDNNDYLGAVRWSTGSTTQVKTRFRMAHNAFDKLLIR